MAEDWRSKLGALMAGMPEETPVDEENVAPAEERKGETARLDIVLERKGRAGKTATIVCGFTMPDEDVASLASELKQRLGTGGSSRGGEILIQGDRRNDVLKFLVSKGYKARII